MTKQELGQLRKFLMDVRTDTYMYYPLIRSYNEQEKKLGVIHERINDFCNRPYSISIKTLKEIDQLLKDCVRLEHYIDGKDGVFADIDKNREEAKQKINSLFDDSDKKQSRYKWIFNQFYICGKTEMQISDAMNLSLRHVKRLMAEAWSFIEEHYVIPDGGIDDDSEVAAYFRAVDQTERKNK